MPCLGSSAALSISHRTSLASRTLGCSEGRSASTWVDFNMWGACCFSTAQHTPACGQTRSSSRNLYRCAAPHHAAAHAVSTSLAAIHVTPCSLPLVVQPCGMPTAQVTRWWRTWYVATTLPARPMMWTATQCQWWVGRRSQKSQRDWAAQGQTDKQVDSARQQDFNQTCSACCSQH